MERKMLGTTVAATLLTAAVQMAAAGEIGFEEEFALAPDRAAPLKQLIAGTEDYYYYNVLQAQHAGDIAKGDELLQAWIARHGRTAKAQEAQYRQALLRYTKDPKASLSFIAGELHLFFNHERETLERQAALPTSLDQNLISHKTLVTRALADQEQVRWVEPAAMETILSEKLTNQQLSNVLAALQRPDVKGLTEAVLRNLNDRTYGASFGNFTIHRQLLQEQLDELVKAKPSLINDTNFVTTYLTKLAPAADVDLKHNVKEREAYLDRVWTFVEKLGPSFNALKAAVLYERLAFDRTQGKWDKTRLLTYLTLPRRTNYVNPEWARTKAFNDYAADLNADYSQFAALPPIRSDDALIRSYLLHLLVDAKDFEEFAPYIDTNYLRQVFAEAKLTSGVGDADTLFNMLSPEQLKALKERVDIDFAETNPPLVGPGDSVALKVDLKNVPTLIVKVYEINTLNFYRTFQREVDTDINLDGLVPNDEQVFKYDDAPIRRVSREFKFPKLDKRGVYVVEFIGNGKSSRALVRKGKLRYVEETKGSGQLFTILDEANKPVPEATLWLDGKEFSPDKDGLINVPFSTAPQNQQMILKLGDFASLDKFQHDAENYGFTAGIHVERGALVRGAKTKVLIRPGLAVNNEPIAAGLLEDVRLTITSTDRDGIPTSKEVPGLKFEAGKELAYEFTVPDRLASITFTVRAKIQSLSLNKKIDLAASRTFAVNAIDSTDNILDLFLGTATTPQVIARDATAPAATAPAPTGARYWFIDVLGKSGESKADRPVNLVLKHRDFTEPVYVTLKSDPNGRVNLGSLDGIDSVSATGPDGATHQWNLPHDETTFDGSVHAAVGEPVLVPWMAPGADVKPENVSLLEVRHPLSGSVYTANKLASATVKGGLLIIKDLPAGDYDLLLKDSRRRLTVRISTGDIVRNWVVSENRYLELKDIAPLQIVNAQASADKVTIQLDNFGKNTRVHVIATRFVPEYSLWADMAAVGIPQPGTVTLAKQETVYVAGRSIGDEYRYIIDRRYAPKLPGNMLGRPQLLLNPWAIRKTETGQQEPAPPSFFGAAGSGAGRANKGNLFATKTEALPSANYSQYDFLPAPTAILENLAPDDKGVVTIDRKLLGNYQHIQIVALDRATTVLRQMTLNDPGLQPRDLRLLNNLDVAKHFTEQKQITVLTPGQSLTMNDTLGANAEVYDALPQAYRLYLALSQNATLAEFEFITRWPSLKPEEKREKYSKYACHELHYFLYRKDPDFFKTVVLPYLANKKDKTFMDRYLLGEDLSGYAQPWAYEQLNTVEKALLAEKVAGEQPRTARYIKDRYDLLPPNIDYDNQLFNTALKTGAMEVAAGPASQAGMFGLRPMGGSTEPPPVMDLADVTRNGTATEGGGGVIPSMPAPTAPGATAPAMKSLSAAQDRTRQANLRNRAKDEVVTGKADALEDDVTREKFRRDATKSFFRQVDKTEEWVENNYYQLPIEQQNPDLVTVNVFWRDFAAAPAHSPFLNRNLAYANHNFTEIMFALANLDLPFEPGKNAAVRKGNDVTFTADTPAVIYHKAIQESAPAADKTPILISQNYFRADDRYTFVDNEQTDKYVADEFLTNVVYGCQVVVTNPTSSRQKLDLLLQLPKGAMPVRNAQYTRGLHADLQPYQTQAIEYYFYFPRTSADEPAKTFPHYPVQVAKNEKLIAFAPAGALKVVDKPTKIDTTSWEYISQNGSNEDVLKFLRENNVERLDLVKIAWRMKDPEFFTQTTTLLASRHAYNQTLWSYALKHDQPAAINEYLKHSAEYLAHVGPFIQSPLLTIDPVVQKTYQHREYAPLVNARAHKLGTRRQIVNDRFYDQYEQLLRVLAYKPALDNNDLLAVTYYLLLQDRVPEAQAAFAKIDPKTLATRLQYDYLTAYLDFYKDAPAAARQIAANYKTYPVDRWRNLFNEVAAQVEQIEGKPIDIVDKDNRNQQTAKAAATEPNLDVKVEARKVTLTYQNVSEVRVNYYLMDVELLFSQNPFLGQFAGQFSLIKPNETAIVKLDLAKPALAKPAQTFDLPAKFQNANVMVEVVGAGLTKAQAYYANSLQVQIVENYGSVKVTSDKTGKALPKTYVKAYAKMNDGTVKFYKDGYTDLRGMFDYASLSTNELDNVSRFALLIMSEDQGVVVREAAPPKR